MSGELGTLVLVLLALGTISLLALLLGDLRELASPQAAPFVWTFLRRRGANPEALGGRGVRVAELRCAACPSRHACAPLAAAGAATPAAGCPNGALFEKFHLRGATA